MATSAVLILLAALLPAQATATDCRRPAADHSLSAEPSHTCGIVLPVAVGTYDMGTYAPGSAYEATLRHLAATIPGKANAESCNCSNGNIAGESPNVVVASAHCSWHPGAKSTDCGACIALAFQEAQRLCPYQRMAEAVVDGGACTANFHDYDIMEEFQHGDPTSKSLLPSPSPPALSRSLTHTPTHTRTLQPSFGAKEH